MAEVTKIRKVVDYDESAGVEGFLYVQAEAEITIRYERHYIRQTITSPGVYRIDDASDAAYLEEVYREERAILEHMLRDLCCVQLVNIA